MNVNYLNDSDLDFLQHCSEEQLANFARLLTHNEKGKTRLSSVLMRNELFTYNVGWHFNKRFEGKGFACEAAAGLLDYLFREAGARRIYGFVEDDNIRSKRLCERLGMRREGCFKEFVTFVNNPDGSPKYEDTCVYAILEKEWNTIRQW